MQPLARAMREYVQLDIAGGGTPPSFEEAMDRVGRAAYTRREALKLGGAAGAALALSVGTRSRATASTAPPPLRTPSPGAHDARVVVVGAGLAGTTAAYRLAQQGVPVQLFEARERVGGRCWTARGFADGQTAEHGGEFIDTRHVHLRGLARELGLKLDDLFKGYPPHSVWPDWVGGKVFDHAEIKAQMDRISKAVTAEAHRIGVFGAHGKASDAAYYYGSATPAAVRADQPNMLEWLDANVPGLSQDIKDFLNETMSTWYGLDMPALSALTWGRLLRDPDPGRGRALARARGQRSGSEHDRPPAPARRAPPGSRSPVDGEAKRRNVRAALQRLGETGDRGLRDPGDALDHASGRGPGGGRPQPVPADGDREPRHGHRREAPGAVHEATVEVQGRWRRRHLERRDGAHGSELRDVGEPTDEPGSSGLITVFAGGSGSMVFANSEPHVVAPEPIVTRIIGDIDDVVPGSRQHYNGTAWLDYWTGDEWTRGSYAAYTPDQMTKYWGYAGIPEGHVHFAGEHTSTYSQGFLNGGVESGQRTAIEIMRRLGVHVPRSIASLPYSRIPGYPI